MTKNARLKLIKKICKPDEEFCGYLFTPREDDLRDELDRLPCHPDPAEPKEEMLLAMDAIFEGGQ